LFFVFVIFISFPVTSNKKKEILVNSTRVLCWQSDWQGRTLID